jgi:transaldolase
MALTLVDSPLATMVERTPTDFWNDSCALDDVAYAVERGGTGATSNPVIVGEVMRREREVWEPRVRELAESNPTWSEVDLTWAITEEMGVRAAAAMRTVFDAHAGRKGRLSLQTNPALYGNADAMLAQGERFHRLAPNIQVKFPTTAAGLVAIEEATARGVAINSTVGFTVSQALAVGEAVERGLRRFEVAGGDPESFAPVCTLMVGRLDDWVKVLVERDDIALDPAAAGWAGIAAFKRAYGIYQERGYRTRLLAAAMRHRLHWTELVGGDVIITMPHAWQVRFNESGIAPEPRIDEPVPSALVEDLLTRIPDFARAYEPGGMAAEEFDGYGATRRTLRTFIGSYHELVAAVRDVMLPDPDARPAARVAARRPA